MNTDWQDKERAARDAVSFFVEVVRTSDGERFGEAFYAVYRHGVLPEAFRAIANLSPKDEFRARCLWFWVKKGNNIRDWVGDDDALIVGAWVLLPRYTGPGLTLYRGEIWTNCYHRTYGLSWSDSADVARDFARAWENNAFTDGSALLVTSAPAEAIICANNDIGEQEYVVDRRHLGEVRVLERFQPPPNSGEKDPSLPG